MSAASTVPTPFVTAVEVPPEIVSLPVIEDHDASKHMVYCFVTQVHQVFGHILGKKQLMSRHATRKMPRSSPVTCQVPSVSEAFAGLHVRRQQVSEPSLVSLDHCPSLFASVGSVGVVDLGASQTVIGSQQVPELLAQLPDGVRQGVKRKPCHLIFRFGNHQALVSRQALLMPLQSQYFQIAIVDGRTPF